MAKKMTAVDILASHIRDQGLTEARRRHAVQTLEMISKRRFHDTRKLGDAGELLAMHGK
jgi:hypothetical protein